MTAIDQASIRDKIRSFISETFLYGNEKNHVADTDSFMQKGIIDSTGVLELANFVESEFGISIQDNEMIPDNLDSIDNLARYIARKVG